MRRPGLQRSLALATLFAGAAASYWLHVHSGIEWQPESFRRSVAELGAIGPLAIVAMMALRPFLGLPSGLILFSAGILFGTVAGTLYGATGGAIGGVLAFAVARALGRDAVQRRLGPQVAHFDELVARRGAPWLALYTALPGAVLSPVFFAAGVTRMRAPAFSAAITLGFVPRAGLFTFLGHTVSQPSRANLALAAVLVVLAGAVVWLAQRHFRMTSPRIDGGSS